MEQQPAWRKSARSGNEGCVEVADLPDGGALVRDSKDPAGPQLRFNKREWDAFIAGVKDGEFG
ncbi:DUF397 domain-containing protein [Microbispora rosea]|uniref:DUF397 domain-containing protein n=1 Tax=Microbispora rosea TaxID=58117 RepID=UPI0037AE6DD0